MNPQETARPQLAIFGGTFDPPHWGHMLLARDVVEQAGIDRLLFVPAGQNPHKVDPPVASGEDRLAMLQAAVADEPAFEVVDLEVRCPGPSYAIKTVAALQKQFPDAQLVWVLGADQLPALPRWHAFDQLVRAVEFLVLARPNHVLAVPDVAKLRWRKATARLIEISATEIRARVAAGKPVDFFVPPRVLAYIQQRKLYLR